MAMKPGEEILRAGAVIATLAGAVSNEVRPFGATSAEARTQQVSPEVKAQVEAHLRSVEKDFDLKFKDRFNFSVTLKFDGMTGGAIQVFKKGEEDRDSLANVQYSQFWDTIQQIKTMNGLGVAAEILERRKQAIALTIGATQVEISKYALALMDLSGTKLSSDNRYLTLPDGSRIDLTGQNLPSRNVSMKIMGATGTENPTILVCTFNENNVLEGYIIILGNLTDRQTLSKEEVRRRCR